MEDKRRRTHSLVVEFYVSEYFCFFNPKYEKNNIHSLNHLSSGQVSLLVICEIHKCKTQTTVIISHIRPKGLLSLRALLFNIVPHQYINREYYIMLQLLCQGEIVLYVCLSVDVILLLARISKLSKLYCFALMREMMMMTKIQIQSIFVIGTIFFTQQYFFFDVLTTSVICGHPQK